MMTVRPRQMEDRSAVVAHTNGELVATGRLPEAASVAVVVDGQDGHRLGFLFGRAAHQAARRIRALPGGRGVDVTRHTSAPGTCDVDSPRIWRTPSRTWFMPWMYPSDRWPPPVLMGIRPSRSISPLDTNAPPSPFEQKPKSSSCSSTVMVKQS